MGLSNYQLVLLDNLIYLDEITRVDEKKHSIGDVLRNLLYEGGNLANEPGTGTIQTDCLNHYTAGTGLFGKN